MSNKNKAASQANKLARHLKQLEEEYQTRLNNSNAVFFTMQVKSRPENKDLTFQEYCNDKNVKPLNKSKIKWRNIK